MRPLPFPVGSVATSGRAASFAGWIGGGSRATLSSFVTLVGTADHCVGSRIATSRGGASASSG